MRAFLRTSAALLVSVAAIWTLHSCDEFDELGKFTFSMDYSNITFEVDSVDTVGTFVFDTEVITNTIKDDLSDFEGVDIDNVEEVYLESLTLEILDSSANFDPIAAITLTIGADGIGTSTLAQRSNIPQTQLQFLDAEVPGTSQNLREFFEANEITIEASGELRAPIESNFEVKATANFEVTVDPKN